MQQTVKHTINEFHNRNAAEYLFLKIYLVCVSFVVILHEMQFGYCQFIFVKVRKSTEFERMKFNFSFSVMSSGLKELSC